MKETKEAAWRIVEGSIEHLKETIHVKLMSTQHEIE